jgi:hypothetical protein
MFYWGYAAHGKNVRGDKMAKLLLLSTVLVSIVWPILAAQDANPRRGLRRAVQGMVLYHIFYVFAVLEIYPRMSH